MIEFVYRENSEEKGTEWKPELPKNVKQIGEPEEKRKIYIEDYVITYLKRLAGEETLNSKLAILLGDTERAGRDFLSFYKGRSGTEGSGVYRTGNSFYR